MNNFFLFYYSYTTRVPQPSQYCEKKKDLIFIAVTAYKDPEIIPTIEGLMANADFPQNLRFGVVLQDTTNILERYMSDPRFKVNYFDPKASFGAMWALTKTQYLYADEEYVFMIDSHTRVVKHWDTLLKQYLLLCNSSKPILSCYPPPFEPTDTNGTFYNWYLPVKMHVKGYSHAGLPNPGGEYLSDAVYKETKAPIPSVWIAGGFTFTYGYWFREVEFEPTLYFDGVELSYTLASYIRGWDIFAPHRVVGYHFYERKNYTKHWGDSNYTILDWRTKLSLETMKILIEDANDSKRFKRTATDYKKLVGLDPLIRDGRV